MPALMPSSASLSPVPPAYLGDVDAGPNPEYSPAIQEIIGWSPPWVLRSGATALAGCAVVMLFIGWLVRYPDTVTGQITVTGTHPAAPVVARQSGHLAQLCVKEGVRVEKGALLAVIDSPADATRILRIREELDRLRPFLADPAEFATLDLTNESRLGPVQPAYADFQTAYRAYQLLLVDEYAAKTLTVLQSQRDRKQEEVDLMKSQVASMKRDLDLAGQAFERMKKLKARDTISTAEMQSEERRWLAQQREHSTVVKALSSEEIALSEYERQIRDLTHKRTEDLRLARTTLAEALKKGLAAIEAFESDYVLRAPVSGTVAFYDFWSDQQFVTAGKDVFVIAPDTTALLGRIPLKGSGLGKVKAGQTVRIKLDDFPYKEFGLATGQVQGISLVAQQGQQLVSVSLPYPLRTHLGKSLAFKQEMTGEAQIVTEDRRLLGRVFDELRRAFTGSTR